MIDRTQQFREICRYRQVHMQKCNYNLNLSSTIVHTTDTVSLTFIF
jgi:hypothetical protein